MSEPPRAPTPCCREASQRGVTSKPKYFIESFSIVPSAFASVMALSNRAFSSGSLFRRPTELPRPSMPPWKRGPDERHLLVAGLRGSAGQIGGRGHDRIDTARREIEVVLLRGLVFPDLGRALQVLVEEVRRDRRALHADGLALQHRLELLHCSSGSCFVGRQREDLGVPRHVRERARFRTAKVWPVVP